MSKTRENMTGWLTCLSSGGLFTALAFIAIVSAGCSDTDDGGGDEGDDLVPVAEAVTNKSDLAPSLCFDGIACVACADDDTGESNSGDLRCVDSAGPKAE